MKISRTLTPPHLARKMTLLFALSIACFLPTVIWGADPDPKTNFLEVQFEDLDADKNDVITLEEFINTPLGIIRKNDLRKLVRHKIPEGSLQQGEVHFQLTADEKRELFKSLDRDRDNTIIRNEWVILKDGKFMF